MQLGYSMQDWFLRIAFAPSCAGETDDIIAEMHSLHNSDHDVVVNSKWLGAVSEVELRAVLVHECTHAIEQFIAARKAR